MSKKSSEVTAYRPCVGVMLINMFAMFWVGGVF
jgi:hypothetical protein